VRVRVRHADAPVAGALVRAGARAAQTDARGEAALALDAGPHTLVVSRVGFAPTRRA
jgi:hypothetical protein